MAKNFCILLLALFVFLSSITENMAAMVSIPVNPNAHLDAYGYTRGKLRPQDCSSRCGFRCSKTAYKKPCMFFCQKCCATCLCVPPGTFGNKQMCPCYNNWKTKRGGPKCP